MPRPIAKPVTQPLKPRLNATQRSMKIINLKEIAGILCAAVSLTFAAVWPVFGQSGESCPVHVAISVATSSEITLGEPIVLHYCITNDSDHELLYLRGPYNTMWYTFTLADSAEQSASVVPDARPTKPGGAQLGVGPYGVLHANSTTQGYIVATRYAVPLHAGQYTLTVHVNMPYADYVGTLRDKASLSELTHECFVKFQILPANPARMRSQSQSLANLALQSKDASDQSALIEALFTMPMPEALPAWKSLIANQNASPRILEHAADQLVRLPFVETADILAAMAWPATRHKIGSAAPQAQQCLKRMYDAAAGANLIKHIAAIYAAHGIDQKQLRYSLVIAD